MANPLPNSEELLAKMDEHFGTRTKRVLRRKAVQEFPCAKCGAKPGVQCLQRLSWWHHTFAGEVHDERLVVAIMVYGPPQPSGLGDD